MDFDAFSLKKRCLPVGAARVAYYEEGTGEPVIFLHGCPFSSYIWRKVIPRLSTRYRCLAPDLLGLGDTETPASADWANHVREALPLPRGARSRSPTPSAQHDNLPTLQRRP